MRAAHALVALGTAGALALLVGCDPIAGYCGKKQECNDSLEDDSYAVCVQSLLTQDRMLRANKQEECHRVADAQLTFNACLASLGCRDFNDGDYDDCEEQLEDLRDAVADADEGQCLSTN